MLSKMSCLVTDYLFVYQAINVLYNANYQPGFLLNLSLSNIEYAI
jgi:hypothetical protein